MPTLCFGGSFNPIHHGHLICARAVAERKGFDRIVLIPSPQPPHKPATATLAPANDRLTMCQLATKGSPIYSVSDVEVLRSGPSFTIDTVRGLRESGWHDVNWLIGADMLLSLPRWHEPAELLREVNFVIMARPGWALNWDLLPLQYRHLHQNVVEAPLIDISATDLRRRVAEGLAIDYLTPREVERHIRKRSLYA